MDYPDTPFPEIGRERSTALEQRTMVASPLPPASRPESRDTPVRRQYQRLKAQHPDCVLLFQLGDFFESFDQDARTVAQVCGVTLTSRELGKGDRVPLAGVPIARLEHYLARLVEAGLHVAIAEQVSLPGSGLVERQVTRVVTPGTLAEAGLLREKENNYLAAIVAGRSGIGLAYVDVTTGEFATTQLDGEDAEARLGAELDRLDPSELLIPEGQKAPLASSQHATTCQPWRFAEAAARDRLCGHLGVLSLEGFGCADRPLAIGAAGAILSYLEENNRRLLTNLIDLHTYTTSAGMVLDGYTRRNLELLRSSRTGRLEGSLLAVLDRTCTPMGGRLLRRWISQPLLDLAEIGRRLDGVEALVQADAFRGRLRTLLARAGDLERQTGRIAQGVASARELLDLAESLRGVAKLRALLEYAAPGGLPFAAMPATTSAPGLDSCSEVVDLIAHAVAPTGGGRLIRAGYSQELDDLVASISQARRWIARLEQTERQRTGIKSIRVGHNQVFGYYLEITRPNLHLVPSDYQRKQTLVAAERFITPELKEQEARILRAEELIQDLERQLFEGLLSQLAAYAPRLRRLAGAVARLDVLAALAEVARERGYCRPILDDGTELHVVEGRHPVVDAHLEHGAFIPNDCHLGSGHCQLMLVTGPNMAGKSTYLRQVALIVLMAQIGSFVPARQARLSVADRIFTRVGAQDDIASGASTFMVEMLEAANILRHASARSLVVLDEIGRGTSTYDGLAIARAVVEDLQQRLAARTLFATHFHELSALEADLPGVRAFSMAVAEEQGEVVFLRKVLPGGAARSYGLHVARLAGLPGTVIRRAEHLLRELEAQRATVHGSGAVDLSAQPLQPALAGFDPLLATPVQLLEQLLSLELANLTPMEALNQLWQIQRRAGRV